MAPKDKPYRVYRGGRVKGKVPAVPVADAPPRRATRKAGAGSAPGGGALQRRFRAAVSWKHDRAPDRARRRSLLAIAWGVTGFLSFSERRLGREQAVRPRARREGALAKSNGFLLNHGDDDPAARHRQLDRRPAAAATATADSIMLLRTDPSHHQLSYLSIPRDLLVPSPGVGNAKINAAYQAGGAALAIKTVHDYTGVPIDHVVIVDFNGFKDLIDAEGGITINVPEPILSNRFDCPYKTEARCLQWKGWRFRAGTQHMNGERALIYSRIRENQLNPGENDLTRGARQQAVVAGRRGEADLARDPRRPAVRRQLADEAARDRPLDVAAARARLGEVPRRPARTRSTAASAATRRPSAAPR